MSAAASIAGEGMGIVGGLIGCNQASKAVENVGQQNPSTQGVSMLGAQTATAPGQYNAYAQYDPMYAGIDSSVANQQMGSSAAMYGVYNPQIDALNNASNTAYQQSMINGVTQNGQTVLNQLQQLNPQLYSQLNAATATANNPSQQTTQLEQMLGTQAQQQLALGTQLSGAEQRDATQQADAANAARGLYDSNSTVGAEMLNNYNLGQQRLQQRQTFATNVDQLLRSNQSQQYQNQLSAANAWSQNAFNPYAGILGQQSGNQLNSQNIASLNAQTNAYDQQATRQQFDPYNSYASSLYGQNQSAQLKQALAQAGISSNMWSGITDSAGSMAGTIAGLF